VWLPLYLVVPNVHVEGFRSFSVTYPAPSLSFVLPFVRASQ
jgi:hypothetical protein